MEHDVSQSFSQCTQCCLRQAQAPSIRGLGWENDTLSNERHEVSPDSYRDYPDSYRD